MKVRDIMTQPPHTCTTTMSLAHASRRMREHGCGTLVVLREGRVAGILTDRDLALALDAAPSVHSTPVSTSMSSPVHTCQAEDDVTSALATMVRFKVRRLPVVSDAGDVDGLLSVDDIVLWALPAGAVTLHGVIAALRSICSASSAAVRE